MDKSKTKSTTTFISLRVKLLVGFTLLFTVVFALAFYWFYTFATQMAMNRLSEDLKTLLTGVADQIDGDSFQALANEGVPRDDGYTDDPRYWEHVTWLAKMKKVDPRSSYYTYVKGEKLNEVIFIGSSSALKNPPSGAKFLEHFVPDYRPDTIINGLKETTLLMDIYSDKWGSWVSGYTPIKNSKGEFVGGLGVDFRADYVREVQKSIRDKVAIAFAIVYLTLFLLVYYISRTLTLPITSLTHLAVQVGEGNYEQDFSGLSRGRLRDEISTLANNFAIMVSKVYQREQTLRLQVEQLRIEIDQAKQQKQVSEIVDSDFFKDLRAKASTMRNRSRRSTQGGSKSDVNDGTEA